MSRLFNTRQVAAEIIHEDGCTGLRGFPNLAFTCKERIIMYGVITKKKSVEIRWGVSFLEWGETEST
jgi:hypothetical protein